MAPFSRIWHAPPDASVLFPPYIENAGTYTFMKTKTDNDAKFTIACVA
jgi:hypothetical protein